MRHPTRSIFMVTMFLFYFADLGKCQTGGGLAAAGAEVFELKFIPEARKLSRFDNIEVFVHLRNYLTGPIEDHFAIFNHDVIGAYVGPVNPNFVRRTYPNVSSGHKNSKYVRGTVRAWGMVGVNDEGYQTCDLQSIQNFGEYAFFVCPKAGVYRIYAWDKVWAADDTGTTDSSGLKIEPPQLFQPEGSPRPVLAWYTVKGRRYFDIFERDGQYGKDNIYDQDAGSGGSEAAEAASRGELSNEAKHKLLRAIFLGLQSIQTNYEFALSDPIYVEKSTNCYYWMYKTERMARAGHKGSISEVLVESDGESHINIELLIWIAEPSAVPLQESTRLPLDKIVVSEYSKMLTNRYFSLGLFPCLRRAHPAVEITTEIAFVLETDQSNKIKSPHWKAVLKIHTDRLLTTLSDISFTIAGRQNAALFGCFVADTRVFFNIREFQFVQGTMLGIFSLDWKLSRIPDAFAHKVSRKKVPVFGHGVQYMGDVKARMYQPGTSRTDLVVVNNPCIAQEFAVAVGGSLYVAEGLLSEGLKQTTKVYLPGLDDTNTPGKPDQLNRNYLRVADVAFTPTHFVVLLSGGFIILHPTSIKQKGIGRMTDVEKHRPDFFVKRRWCGRTSTPKLSNMIVPGYTSEGSIILIQIYPVEGSVHMWVSPPSQFCLPEGQGFIRKAEELRKKINETEIHFNEYVSVSRSDDRGLPISVPPPRPEPTIAKKDRDEQLTYLIYNDTYIEHGGDPHFPPELANPASQVIGSDLENYNSAVIYVLDEIVEKSRENNVVALLAKYDFYLEENSFDLQAMEFSAVEKQFILGAKFDVKFVSEVFRSSSEVSDIKPFQMLITTMTATELPTVVKVLSGTRGEDEKLKSLLPFPGPILVRSKPFYVPSAKSRDPYEYEDVDQTEEASVAFRTKIFPVSTALPSYVVDLGNVLLFSSLDGRYARPLYHYDWCKLDNLLNPRKQAVRPGPCQDPAAQINISPDPNAQIEYPDLTKPPRIHFNESTSIFYKDRMYDVIVTAQGVISVLWRKQVRHLVQIDHNCLVTQEVNRSSIAIGSVLINDGLRDIHGFFQNDNIFQMASPDGEIIYGKYDVKPHSPFRDCDRDTKPEDTASTPELCIQQAKKRLSGQQELIPVCSKATVMTACRDPGYLKHCQIANTTAMPDTEACLRLNNLTALVACNERYSEPFDPPKKVHSPNTRKKRATVNDSVVECYQDTEKDVSKCWPIHAPREELRSIELLGTSFYGYLHGNLKSVKSIHPEAPDITEGDFVEEELDVCPFIGFSVHNVDFDFAEVGYQTRITGQISFLGTGIPIEADLLVEFQPVMGVVVEISSSVEDERDLTTITKVVDITFVLTDFQLDEIGHANIDFYENNYYDSRAREKSAMFSVTLRPSIVNMYCNNVDFFKTIQFSVGCNTFSTIRLISEAAPFHRYSVENKDVDKAFQWKVANSTLIVPRAHVYHVQVKTRVFNCSLEDGTKCVIPYYELFKDDIFTTSYRDFFFPKFEQFLTLSSRRVTGNMILYDLKGSKEFNATINNLQAGCYSTGDSWYDELRNTTNYIGKGKSEHEYIYNYYKNCFDNLNIAKREQSQTLDATPFYLFNMTNKNMIKFRRHRNQIFIFRAVVLNTEFNRFTYCRTLETFFMVRITGIPIPRQGLDLWKYIVTIFIVVICLVISYIIFFHFYTWKLDSSNPMFLKEEVVVSEEVVEVSHKSKYK